MIVVAVASMLIVYLGVYVVMSRRGYQQSRAVGLKGFFFVLPHDERALQLNRACQLVFYPLVQVEMLLGTGEHPGGEPLQGVD
ncbi:hypothetical protein NA78x_004738 [Anatilimnocola sp. NA78]|uniref:hypothetical protein n=1 Tax=Anatilimnocola sp. NA78 TaxID=3415683 RepID=UPI003CE55BEC